MKRTPRDYDGSLPTGKQLRDLLPEVMETLSKKVGDASYQILEAWSEIVGERIGRVTRAVHFEKGVLKVHVQNSTLLSLLQTHEKSRLIARFRKRFPHASVREIRFKIGYLK